MKQCVILEQDEWDTLPVEVALALHRQAVDGPGRFAVVDAGTGEPIDDRLRDWLVGAVAMAFAAVERKRKGREAGDG